MRKPKDWQTNENIRWITLPSRQMHPQSKSITKTERQLCSFRFLLMIEGGTTLKYASFPNISWLYKSSMNQRKRAKRVSKNRLIFLNPIVSEKPHQTRGFIDALIASDSTVATIMHNYRQTRQDQLDWLADLTLRRSVNLNLKHWRLNGTQPLVIRFLLRTLLEWHDFDAVVAK